MRPRPVASALIALVLGSLGALVLGASPAGAELVCRYVGRQTVCVEVSLPGPVGGSADTGSGGSDEPVYYYRTFVRGGEGVDEGPTIYDGCWAIGATADPEEGGTYAEAQADLNQFVGNGGDWGACTAAEVLDPAEIAALYWQRAAAPPPPTPLQVAPGKALTGLPAYLEIGGDNPYVETHDTPLGVLTFTMTPRYVVSWGDGTTHPSTTSQGGPYPDGDITHTYLDTGAVTITVEAYWTSSWTLAGADGELPELPLSTEASLDLPVEQRQAVID